MSTLIVYLILFSLISLILLISLYLFANEWNKNFKIKNNSYNINSNGLTTISLNIVSENPHGTFIQTIATVLRFFIRKINRYFNFLIHYLVLLFIKLIELSHILVEIIYSKLRNRFVEKSLEDKSYVKHFWPHLKKFKKEIDSEKDL
jgi:hypothetical protein